MIDKEDKMPGFKKDSFICPHCNTYAHQEWFRMSKVAIPSSYEFPEQASVVIPKGMLDNLFLSTCSCGKYTLWIDKKIIYPKSSFVPSPIEEMPEDVKAEYLEAKNIVNESPRGASALLRLALQKLMVHLGEEGKKIDKDIGNLVNKGLSVKIQQALDSIRVIGNESVHPGEMDLKDDINTAKSLFIILNLIVKEIIVQPKEIEELYGRLPVSKKEGIKNRDKNI